MLVSTSVIFLSLKATLDKFMDDLKPGYEKGLIFPKWMNVGNMTDQYVDHLEMAGPSLASETPEGSPLTVGGIMQGVMKRYIARKFGKKMVVTDEAIEDTKYDQVLSAGKRLMRIVYKTADISATTIAARGWNASYPGADGVALFSTAHPLPRGGTFSNTLAVPISPSRAAVIQLTTMARLFPGHDGTTEGHEPQDIVCPTTQWAVWDGVVKSEKAPEPGNFNEINVAKDVVRGVVSIKYWSNSTTNFFMTTDCENGLNFFWKRKPRQRSWPDEDNEAMNYGVSARWDHGWSDPRCAVGSGA